MDQPLTKGQWVEVQKPEGPIKFIVTDVGDWLIKGLRMDTFELDFFGYSQIISFGSVVKPPDLFLVPTIRSKDGL